MLFIEIVLVIVLARIAAPAWLYILLFIGAVVIEAQKGKK